MLQIAKLNMPVISIITATFNREELLERAIVSVLRQTCDLWELLVIDDGSADNTFNKVRPYIEKTGKIRYFRHTNRGLALSRNAGLQAAAGEYVTFLDSDDEYLPEHLELRLKYMKENSNVDLIHGGTMIVGNPFVPDKNDTSKEIHLDKCAVGGTFFGKRPVFISLGGFKDIDYSEDSDLMERATEIYRVQKVSFPTYVYHRDTADGICNSRIHAVMPGAEFSSNLSITN